MKQEMIAWQWHQLHHVQIICTSLQTDNHASTSSLNLLTGWVLFQSPNQRCQSTEGTVLFCSLAFLDPRVGHTMDVLSPFISILCHSD